LKWAHRTAHESNPTFFQEKKKWLAEANGSFISGASERHAYEISQAECG